MFRRMLIGLLLVGFLPAVRAEAPKTHKASQKWALLIGINDYTYLSKLKFCAADMQALRGQLLEAGFVDAQIRLVSDKEADRKYWPSKTNIETQVDLVCRLAEEGDVILLAYSGHGVERRGQGYLCPQDAKIDSAGESLIPVDWIYTRLGKSKAALRLMVVDACREELDPNSTRGADDVAEANKRFVKQLNSVPKGTVLLNSCGPDEFAREDKNLSHGVFSHFLLKGLAGEADENADGIVTVGELAKFTARETRNYVALKFASAQFPYIKQDADIGALDYDLGRVKKQTAPVKPAGPKVGDTITNSFGQKFTFIPSGEFLMGDGESVDDLLKAFPGAEKDLLERAAKQHRVRITKPFYLGVHHVTKGDFARFVSQEGYKTDVEKDDKGGMGVDAAGNIEQKREYTWRNPSFIQGDDNPVVNGSWNDDVA